MGRKPGEYSVHYDSSFHFQVIFQLYGSVWPFVWMYCVFNVILVVLVELFLDPYWKENGIVMSEKPHTLSVFIVSFFVVSRATMALQRYNEARTNLSKMYCASRELISAIVRIFRFSSLFENSMTFLLQYFSLFIRRKTSLWLPRNGEIK